MKPAQLPAAREVGDIQLEEVRDQRIRRGMRHRCSVSCVLPAGHEGLHMRQDGTRISEEEWPWAG